MKRKIEFLALLLLPGLLFLNSCKNDEIVENIPKVVSLDVSPQTLTYGEELTVNAHLKDDAVSLYQAIFTYSIGGQNVKLDTFKLSSSDQTVTDIFKLNLYRNAPDNAQLSVKVEVMNSEGGVDSLTVSNVTVKRPTFNNLYLQLENGDVLEMTKRITDANVFECAWVLSNDINVKVLSNATTPQSGLVWGNVNGAFDLSDDGTVGFFNLLDPLIVPSKITFNILTFDLEFEGTTMDDGNMWIGLAKLSQETGIDPNTYPGITVMKGTGHFTKNGQVYFRGFPNSVDISKILNPDFFEMRDGKYYFTQETDDYIIRYDMSIGFLFVYPVDSNYPKGIYIAGWGFGPPVQPYTTVRSDYNFDDETLPPGVFYFMPKIADGVYAATVYLAVDTDDFIGFNFYYQKGWGDPVGFGPGGKAEVTGAELAYSTNDAFPLSNGAVWRENIHDPKFTNGVYLLKIDFNKRELSATLKTAN
jgi:hypothetical protein